MRRSSWCGRHDVRMLMFSQSSYFLLFWQSALNKILANNGWGIKKMKNYYNLCRWSWSRISGFWLTMAPYTSQATKREREKATEKTVLPASLQHNKNYICFNKRKYDMVLFAVEYVWIVFSP